MTDQGNRVENGTQCTNTSTFSMADGFYQSEDQNLKLPNFAEWSGKEQFNRGLYAADTVVVDRYLRGGFRFLAVGGSHVVTMSMKWPMLPYL